MPEKKPFVKRSGPSRGRDQDRRGPRAEPGARPSRERKPAYREEAELPIEPPAPQPKPSHAVSMLIFNRWDTTQVEVRDLGLKSHISVSGLAVPRTGGRLGTNSIGKNRMPIVERFMNKLRVNGHRGRKHKITSGQHVGNTMTLYNEVKEAFIIIEKKTKQNPVQVLVGAIENSALLEEVASYRLGGIIARNSVVTSPQRRLDLALRHLTQGIYRASFRNRLKLHDVIANELIAAFNSDSKSFAISERNRIEKEAEGAR
jgi:small subunit ribosomal protein S7